MKKKKGLQERIDEVVKEDTAVVDYNPNWVAMFRAEKVHLTNILPADLVKRIEHFGSTSVVGLPAKPVIDMLVEVSSLEETKKLIAPILEELDYDYFWRPDGQPGGYAWFIKRDDEKKRSHHIHMVEKDSPLWERLLFRDYLIKFPEVAKEYAELKLQLYHQFPNDRIQYHNGKTDFVLAITSKATRFFN